MGKKARLFRCPPVLLRAAASILGRQGELQRLTANLSVDPALAQTMLGWQPTVTLPVGIAEMVHWFMLESHA
jgi:nucleoside-diphosphate-sugar epimerase